MAKYLELVGRIEDAIKQCVVKQEEAKAKNDFENEHKYILFAELLRGILDGVESNHYR